MKREEIKRIIQDLPFDVLYAGVVGSSVVREGRDVDVVVIAESDEKPMLFHEGRISVLTLGREWLTYKKHEEMPTGLVPSILFKYYLVALVFEKLLKSGSIGEFEFDEVRLARKIGLKEIAEKLENLY